MYYAANKRELLRQVLYSINLNFKIMKKAQEERIKEIIVTKLPCEESEIVTEAHLTKDLGADSLDRIELIMEIENNLGITLPDRSYETVGDIYGEIEKLDGQ